MKQKWPIIVAVAVVACLVAGALAVAVILFHLPGYPAPNEVRPWVEERSDINEIQKWAIKELVNVPAGATYKQLDPADHHLPECVRALDPQYVFITGGSAKDSHIVIAWGSGHGHWGLYVGRPSFRSTDTHSAISRWRDGVYTFTGD